jgi:CubicO group peptidase (beta-lactamase class C family)
MVSRFKCFTIFFLIIIAGYNSAAENPLESKTSIAEKRIDTYINALIADQHIPGYSIAVTSEGSLIYANSYGFSDIKLKEKVTNQTLFQIGSITKSFTAISLMQLYDSGKFDPHKPVSDYLDWFNITDEQGKKVTGHHLLTHRAGIQAGLDGFYGSPAMAVYAGQLKSYGKLGDQFNYSNIGYVVLHLLVEHLSGVSYQEYVTKNILQPLEMTDTQAEITLDSRDKQAIGYVYPFDNRPQHPSRKLVEVGLFEYRMGDGSILSTASDMAKYMQMLLGNGTRKRANKETRIITKEAFDLFTGINHKTKKKGWYQYGIDTRKHDAIYRIQHSGGMVGFSTDMIVDKANDIGVYVSTNTPYAPHRLVTSYIFDVYNSLKSDKALPEIPSIKRKKNKALTDYTGKYQSTDGEQLEIKVAKDGLEIVDANKLIKLDYVRKHRFQSLLKDYDKYYWVFKSEDDKNPSKLIYGEKVYYSINYTGKTVYDFPKEWQGYTGVYRSYSPWFPYFEIIIREGTLIAITGFGGETVFREIELFPTDLLTFKIEYVDSLEQLSFGNSNGSVQTHSVTASWSGHEFYWTGGK